ncbi:MAG: hypothetical protein ACKV2T_05400 [Kofleriaceae bacterium]
MKQLLVLAFIAITTGCAGTQAAPTIRGMDLYARVGDLQAGGRVFVPSARDRSVHVEVRRDHYLVDRARSQVFVVSQIVEGCHGTDVTTDATCALALVADQRFAVESAAPQPRSAPSEHSKDLEPITRVRLALLVAGVAMGVGAAKCDAFDGCGEVLAIGAGLDALLLLVAFTGFR